MAKVIVKLQPWEFAGLMAKVIVKFGPLGMAGLGCIICDFYKLVNIGGRALWVLRPGKYV
jgi:ABC-type uncharacterized transport system permease subunit